MICCFFLFSMFNYISLHYIWCHVKIQNDLEIQLSTESLIMSAFKWTGSIGYLDTPGIDQKLASELLCDPLTDIVLYYKNHACQAHLHENQVHEHVVKARNPYVMKNIFKNEIPYLICVIQAPVTLPCMLSWSKVFPWSF